MAVKTNHSWRKNQTCFKIFYFFKVFFSLILVRFSFPSIPAYQFWSATIPFFINLSVVYHLSDACSICFSPNVFQCLFQALLSLLVHPWSHQHQIAGVIDLIGMPFTLNPLPRCTLYAPISIEWPLHCCLCAWSRPRFPSVKTAIGYCEEKGLQVLYYLHNVLCKWMIT